jgi:hypothetical protein
MATFICASDASSMERGAVGVARFRSERLDVALVLARIAAQERERQEAELLLPEMAIGHWLGRRAECRAFGSPAGSGLAVEAGAAWEPGR